MVRLKPGKRYYWFSASCHCIHSGLFNGEYSKSGCAIIHRRNGDIWELPKEILFATKEEALRKSGIKKRMVVCK